MDDGIVICPDKSTTDYEFSDMLPDPGRAKNKTGSDSEGTQSFGSDSEDTLLLGSEKILIDTYEDHRVAMSFAVTGTRLPGIVISDPECSKKTFPDFFNILDSITEE